MAHATAAILAIGDELTLGQSLDTNSRWISARLVEAGVRVVEHATVEDELERIASALRRFAADADLVVATGGLGPTADDLTRAALAQVLGEELIEDADALREIEASFRRVGRPVQNVNRVQALRPPSATSLPNPNGTAPGLYLHLPRGDPAPSWLPRTGMGAEDPPPGPVPQTGGGVDVFCLPGPPGEMRPMFEAQVVPRLAPSRLVVTRTLHTCGIGESDVGARLGALMARDRKVLVGTNASAGLVAIRIRAERERSADDGAVRAEVDEVARDVRARLEPHVFGEGDESLAERVLAELRQRGETLATVESCTGGLLGAMLTDVPGSSDAMVGGWVTYTNEMKHREVGVPREVFEGAGAVSRECAESMARSGLARAGADHCLSITGIAGPGGGSEAKPVGTVWIARASGGDIEARCFRFPGDRETVRRWSAITALVVLHLHLAGVGVGKLLREFGAGSG